MKFFSNLFSSAKRITRKNNQDAEMLKVRDKLLEQDVEFVKTKIELDRIKNEIGRAHV